MLTAAALLMTVNVWWGAFLALVAVSSIYPFDSVYGLNNSRNVLLFCLWYALIAKYIKNPERVMNAICAVCLVQVTFVALQHFDLDPFRAAVGGGRDVCTGLMANVNETNCLFAMCVPAFFRSKWVWGLPAVGIAMLTVGSAAGMVSVGAGVFFVLYFVFPSRKAYLLTCGVLLIAGVVYLRWIDEGTLKTLFYRWNVAKWALPKIWQHPLLGSGIGHWKVVVVNMMGGKVRWATAHNEYLQGVFEMGGLFLVLVIGYLVCLIRGFNQDKIIPAAAIIIIAVNSLVHFTFHIGTTALVAVTWMGVYEIDYHSELGILGFGDNCFVDHRLQAEKTFL